MNTQLPLSIQLNDESTLDDFYWRGNSWVAAQLKASMEGIGEPFIYLWGNPGAGKSHLLQAACHGMNAQESVIYLPLKLLKDWGPNILDGLEQQTLLCIDDIDMIAGEFAWEEALFHLYNRIRDEAAGRLFLSGTLPPTQLTITLPDLRSRISACLVVQLQELADEDKVQVLMTRAMQRGFELPVAVCQFLLTRFSRNMHDLEQLLNGLDKASLAAHRKITIPFVRTFLTAEIRQG